MEASNQPTNYWGGDSAVKNILLGHWAEIAPKEALAFVTGSNTPATREAQEAIFSQLAITDPKAAEAALAALGEGRKKGALRAMAVRIASDRPLEAIALLDRQKSQSGDYAYYSVISLWSVRIPQAQPPTPPPCRMGKSALRPYLMSHAAWCKVIRRGLSPGQNPCLVPVKV